MLEVEVSVSNLLKMLVDLLTDTHGAWYRSQVSKSFCPSLLGGACLLYFGYLVILHPQLSDDFSATAGSADYLVVFVVISCNLFAEETVWEKQSGFS